MYYIYIANANYVYAFIYLKISVVTIYRLHNHIYKMTEFLSGTGLGTFFICPLHAMLTIGFRGT